MRKQARIQVDRDLLERIDNLNLSQHKHLHTAEKVRALLEEVTSLYEKNQPTKR